MVAMEFWRDLVESALGDLMNSHRLFAVHEMRDAISIGFDSTDVMRQKRGLRTIKVSTQAN